MQEPMLRFFKRFLWVALLAAGLQSGRSWSLMAPPNTSLPSRADNALAWQVPTIGYNLPGDIGGVGNLGEEYRWNTPTIYFSMDQSFLDYFGSNGMVAIQKAFTLLNGLTNFSKYSADLSEFPLESQRINLLAQQLSLVDLKSVALNPILEELGLTDPERYVWTLRSRETQPGRSFPFMFYTTIQRNFDPATFEETPYINGTRWTYLIQDRGAPPNPVAVTINFPVDPLAPEYSAVTSIGPYLPGTYVTSLSRDDVGGLRYLYQTNNMNVESISDDSFVYQTNTLSQLLFTSNLTMFAQQALTNDPVTFQALYPGLAILSVTNTFYNFYVTNSTAYFTNYPWDPVGTPAHLVYGTNVTASVGTYYYYTFGNLYTFSNSPSGWVAVPIMSLPAPRPVPVKLQTISVNISNPPFAPAGYTTIVTNISTKSYTSNYVVGEFFILPTNQCALPIIGSQLTNIVTVTNQIFSVTNSTAATNVAGTIVTYQVNVLSYFTNHVFLTYQVNCTSNSTELRQGMDKLTFVQANYDSLLGRFFQPITNVYHLTSVINSQAIKKTVRRIVTQPDFLFDAADLLNTRLLRSVTSDNFNTANVLPLLGGPGNIEPHMFITFNKIGLQIINTYDPFVTQLGLGERQGLTNFVFASFDGSTNAPIVYPNGVSIMNLADLVLFQILAGAMPEGAVGSPYVAPPLQAAGGMPPYSGWALALNTTLPPGLELSSDGVISGTPVAPGDYSFSVTVHDSVGRIAITSFTINILP